jgi:rhodanese-related sulfurtransferase
MRAKTWILILAIALPIFEGAGYAVQKVDVPAIKPQANSDQMFQVDFITAAELKSKIAKHEPVSIIDLRADTLYEQSDKTIKGAFHTKVRKAATRLRATPRDNEVVTYCACAADEAAIIAARSLLANGFKRVRVLRGGWNAWLQAGGQVQPKAKGL